MLELRTDRKAWLERTTVDRLVQKRDSDAVTSGWECEDRRLAGLERPSRLVKTGGLSTLNGYSCGNGESVCAD